MENQTNSKKKLGTILTVIECVIIAVCLIFSIIVISQPGEIGKNGTTKFLPVQTDSMTPTIPVGSLVFTQSTQEKEYDIGTIVTFVKNTSNGKILDTHRIVGYKMFDNNDKLVKIYGKKGEIESLEDILSDPETAKYKFYSYVTRGDKYTTEFGSMDDFGYSKDESQPVTKYDDDDVNVYHTTIVCVYKSHIGGVGAVLTWFMQPTNFFIVILIPLIALFAYNVYGVVKLIIKMKVTKAKEESKVDEDEIRRRVLAELQAQGVQVPVTATNEQTENAVEEIAENKEEEVENKEESSLNNEDNSGNN